MLQTRKSTETVCSSQQPVQATLQILSSPIGFSIFVARIALRFILAAEKTYSFCRHQQQ